MVSRRRSEKPAQPQTSSAISDKPERKRSVAKDQADPFSSLVNDKIGLSKIEEMQAKLLGQQTGQPIVENRPAERYPTGLPDSNHLAVDLMIDRAIEVIGNRDEAMRWLGTPVAGLDYATPISLLDTSEGARRVEDVLGQMEHGVW